MTDVRTELLERGWAVVEGVFGPGDNARMKAIVEGIWDRAGRPSLGGRFGHAVQPLVSRHPDTAPFYAATALLDVVAEALGERPRLEYTGALLADGTRQFCPWHNHLGGNDREMRGRTDRQIWSRFREHHPGRLHRIVANVYIDGLDARTGELLVHERPIDASPGTLAGPMLGDWPEQEVVRCGPGALVLLDEAVYHAARPPNGLGASTRLLWGGFFIGASTPLAETAEPLPR